MFGCLRVWLFGLFVCLFVCLCVCLVVCLFVCVFVCLLGDGAGTGALFGSFWKPGMLIWSPFWLIWGPFWVSVSDLKKKVTGSSSKPQKSHRSRAVCPCCPKNFPRLCSLYVVIRLFFPYPKSSKNTQITTYSEQRRRKPVWLKGQTARDMCCF